MSALAPQLRIRSIVRAAVKSLRFPGGFQNVLDCVSARVLPRVGNLGDKLFVNQQILACVLKIF